MTGRRLYEHFADAAATRDATFAFEQQRTVLPSCAAPPVAWAFLSARDRKVWGELARRIAPKPRKGAA